MEERVGWKRTLIEPMIKILLGSGGLQGERKEIVLRSQSIALT